MKNVVQQRNIRYLADGTKNENELRTKEKSVRLKTNLV